MLQKEFWLTLLPPGLLASNSCRSLCLVSCRAASLGCTKTSYLWCTSRIKEPMEGTEWKHREPVPLGVAGPVPLMFSCGIHYHDIIYLYFISCSNSRHLWESLPGVNEKSLQFCNCRAEVLPSERSIVGLLCPEVIQEHSVSICMPFP